MKCFDFKPGPKALAFICTCTLSACGGSTAPAVETAPVTPRTTSNAGFDAGIVRDPETGTITLDPDPNVDGGVLNLVPTTNEDVSGFQALETSDGTATALRRATDDTFVLLLRTDPNLEEAFIGSIVRRTTIADIPIEGTASYEGIYAGFLEGEGLDAFGDTVTGRVRMEIDFDEGAMSGTIDQRSTNTGSTMADIRATNGFPLEVGLFTGSTNTPPDASVSAVGAINATAAGNLGSEIVGTVTMSHSFTDEHPLGERTIMEYGGYQATKND